MRLFFSIVMIAIISAKSACAGTVLNLPTIDYLRQHGAAGSSVNVDGYSAAGDGGGGQFVQNGTSCSDDDGVVVKDHSSGHFCWFRQFTGPVHLP